MSHDCKYSTGHIKMDSKRGFCLVCPAVSGLIIIPAGEHAVKSMTLTISERSSVEKLSSGIPSVKLVVDAFVA